MARLELSIALACFPLVFLGELPDKTMFANLVMATRGRPLQVWLGASCAFAVHVAIAVTVGEALVALAPHRVVDAVVAGLFLAGAAYAFVQRGEEPSGRAVREPSATRVALTAFVVIFLAEWGDLTQLIVADLAARYRAPLAVGLGSFAALIGVGALAVSGGRVLLRMVSVSTVRVVTAAALVALAAWSAWTAAR